MLPVTNATIEVFGVSGNVVYSESAVNVSRKTIPLDLAAGTYFVRVQTATGVNTIKFAVVR
jgi:hypothetical protein